MEYMEHKEHEEHKERMEPSMIDDIADELEGACHYAKMAQHFKGKDEMQHRMYMEMVPQELGHAKRLFDLKVKEIEDMIK